MMAYKIQGGDIGKGQIGNQNLDSAKAYKGIYILYLQQ